MSQITGTTGNDLLTGTMAADVFVPLGGSDVIADFSPLRAVTIADAGSTYAPGEPFRLESFYVADPGDGDYPGFPGFYAKEILISWTHDGVTTSGTTTEGDRVFTFASTPVDQLTVQYRQIDSHAGWVTYGAQIQDLHVTFGQGDTIQLPAGAGIEATVASATSDGVGGTVLQAGVSVLTLPHVDPGTVSADWFIQAPEVLPVLSLSLVNPHLVEGLDNSLEAIVSRSSGEGSSSVTLEFTPPPSPYLAGADDFTNHMAPETVTFAPGETSKTVSIGVVDDTLHETTGAFLLRLADPVGATLGDSTVQGGSITDDDAPVLAISTATPVLTEGGGEAFRFTVTRVGGDLSIAGTVGVSIQADAAGAHPASADDIVGGFSTHSLDFAAGETSRSFDIAVADDRIHEADESFVARIAYGLWEPDRNFPTPLLTTVDQVVATIRDDDPAPCAKELVLTLSEDAWKGDALFVAYLDGQPLGEAQAVTALRSAGDSQSFVFRVEAGEGSHQVTVAFLNDAYCGTPDTDRNLYVESIGFDGAVQEFHQAMMTAGCMDFQIG